MDKLLKKDQQFKIFLYDQASECIASVGTVDIGGSNTATVDDLSNHNNRIADFQLKFCVSIRLCILASV